MISPQVRRRPGTTFACSATIERALQTGSPIPTFIPAMLRTWVDLLATYGEHTGHVVSYERIAASEEWKISLSSERYQPGHQMTLNEWNQWHREAAQLDPSEVRELLYLVDVELPENVQDELTALNPFMRLLDDAGPNCLNFYINARDKTITRPHMRSKLYVAPVLVPGAAILTPPHLDGHGTQTSIHTVLFGSGYNLVQIWDLKYGQESHFRRITQLPPANAPQHLPHDEEYFYDTNPAFWHEEKERQLGIFGIRPLSHKLQPGYSILLRAGWPHTFKKVTGALEHEITNFPASSSSDPPPESPAGSHRASPPPFHSDESEKVERKQPIPLAGFAGDISYIGDTVDVSVRELEKIVEGHKRLRQQKHSVYCFWQLALWCMMSVFGTRRDNTPVVQMHLRISMQFVDEMLREEETYLFAHEGEEEFGTVMGNEIFGDEFVCAQCKVCLWNLVLVLKDSQLQPKSKKRRAFSSSAVSSAPAAVIPGADDHPSQPYYCAVCAEEHLMGNEKLSEDTFSIMFRFGRTSKLREQFLEIINSFAPV